MCVRFDLWIAHLVRIVESREECLISLKLKLILICDNLLFAALIKIRLLVAYLFEALDNTLQTCAGYHHCSILDRPALRQTTRRLTQRVMS